MLPLTSGAHLGSNHHAGHVLSGQAGLARRTQNAQPPDVRVQSMATDVGSSSFAGALVRHHACKHVWLELLSWASAVRLSGLDC